MKTKIIYISGNEIFDMNDIRAAFEEVRNALNLDKNTVLFGVPVDNEDAGFATKTDNLAQQNETTEFCEEISVAEPIMETIPEPIAIETEISSESITPENESVMETPVKKRGRPRKEVIEETESITEDENITNQEKVVPILSVLGAKDTEDIVENTDIIPEITEETVEITETVENNEDNSDTDLESLLSAMTPLDVSEDDNNEPIVDAQPNIEEDISVDATLEQLASEFAEKQDKITSENKSLSRNRIGKLRNILPFKQSKHKDTGLGDLFGWAGIAANDEEFSVPGFFTNAASRK